MAATFKIILAHKPDSDGLYNVRLRVIADRVTRYLNVPGVAVQAKQWNAKGTSDNTNWVKTGHYDHEDLNNSIQKLLKRAVKLGRDRPELGADEIKQLLASGEDLAPAKVEAASDFLAFAYASRERDEVGTLGESTCEQRRSVLNKLAEWWGWKEGEKPLPCDQLTEELVADFEAHLKRKLKNGPSTRRKNLKIISRYIKRAIKRNLMPKGSNPIDDYELPTATPVRVWLTDAEFSALEVVALPPMQHLARTTYLIQYYLHGSRIGVVLRLRWKDRGLGVVRFTMDKGGREKVVQESPQLTSLLDSLLPADGSAPSPDAYILPWLSQRYEQMSPARALKEMKGATSRVNGSLKKAALKAGLTCKVSTHTSRRTLAGQADDITGDLGIAQGMLGHSSRRMTEIYTQGRDSSAVHKGAALVYEQRPMPPTKSSGG